MVDINNLGPLKPESDSAWIEDCFINYTHAVIASLNDYYVAVRGFGYGIVLVTDYKLELRLWSVLRTSDNNDVYCNGGKMISIVLTHSLTGRCLKIDLSSFSSQVVTTVFTKLTLDSECKIVVQTSTAIFQSTGEMIHFNSPKLLSKLYNFLEYGITDIEFEQSLVAIH